MQWRGLAVLLGDSRLDDQLLRQGLCLLSLRAQHKFGDRQLVCHFRNDFELTRKDFLIKNYKKARKAVEKETPARLTCFNFIPASYVLPVRDGVEGRDTDRVPSLRGGVPQVPGEHHLDHEARCRRPGPRHLSLPEAEAHHGVEEGEYLEEGRHRHRRTWAATTCLHTSSRATCTTRT